MRRSIVQPSMDQHQQVAVSNNDSVLSLKDSSSSFKPDQQILQQQQQALTDYSFQPCSISWCNVNVWSKQNKSFWDSLTLQPSAHGTQIIKNVSGGVNAGSTLAIMGASGAGKTTLLNVLNARNLSNFYVDGVIRINGRLANIDMITSMSAYVQQEDLFLPTLTVREHLVFQSLVRMDEKIPMQAKVRRINSVMKELSLDKCADTQVGGMRNFKGISGGELKRLSFAVEILTNPSIMFCDEPTSGLDSFMASNLVSIINKLAQAGRTIICTIHQPSSETFGMFQNLLLLADGRVAYFGELKGAYKHFASIGLKCPENYNPADFYIHNLAVIPGQEIKCRKKINRICDYYEKILHKNEKSFMRPGHQSSFANLQIKKKPSRYKVGRYQQYCALSWRSYLSMIREPVLTYVRLIQALINAILLSIIFHDQHYDQKGVGNMNGALFLLLVNMTMQNAFAVINVFCSELPIFIREHNNGMYQVDAYFICKNLAEAPIFVCIPIVFVLIYYYSVNLYPTFDAFLYCSLVGIVLSTCGVSFGYFISCICRDTDVAMSFGPPLIMPFQLLGGFFINTESISSSIRWARFLSWFYYGYDLLTVNQWWNVAKIDCNKTTNAIDDHLNLSNNSKSFKEPSMCFQNGTQVLEFLTMGTYPWYLNFIGLLLLIFMLRLIAFLTLCYTAKNR